MSKSTSKSTTEATIFGAGVDKDGKSTAHFEKAGNSFEMVVFRHLQMLRAQRACSLTTAKTGY